MLEEMLQSIEKGNVEGFSLVENEKRMLALQAETASNPIRRNFGHRNSRVRQSVESLDPSYRRDAYSDAGPGPRYLNKYVSKRT